MYTPKHLVSNNCSGYIIYKNTCDTIDMVRWAFETYIPLIIMALGFVGNALISIVVHRGRYRHLPAYYCLFVIGIIDTLWLISNYMHFYVRKWYESQPEWMNELYCKVTGVVAYASTGSSSWTMCCMVAVRFAAIHWPLRSIHWFSVRRTRNFVIVLVVIIFICHLPFILIEEINEKLDVCYNEHSDMALIINTMHFVFFMVIPVTGLVVINSALSYQIKRKMSRKKIMSSNNKSSLRRVCGHENGHHRKVTVMLVVTSWMYVTLSLPWYIQDIYFTYVKDGKLSDRDKVRSAVNSITWTVSMINYACNFYIYCFMFTDFRHEVARLICRRRKQQRGLARQDYVHAITGSDVNHSAAADSIHPMTTNANRHINHGQVYT